MKSLQRLQQHVLATDPVFGQGIELTLRAQRLRTAFRRGIAVGVTASAALVGAVGTGVYIQTGPGSYDPHKLYYGNPDDSRVMASIYDNHRHLIAARERVQEIKTAMITSSGPETLEQQAVELRRARDAERKVAQEFAQQTSGLTPAQIHHIVDDSTDDETGIQEDATEAQSVAGTEVDSPPPRFRP